MGIIITRGTLGPYDACTIAKAKQKNAPKVSKHKGATKTDERRIFLDILSVKANKQGMSPTKPYWRIMVDERSTLKFSNFFETKNGMAEPTCEQLHRWKQNALGVKNIRLDNAGENKLLQQRAESKDWKLNIQFEYTARDTPQQNHLAELALATMSNKDRACMTAANVPETLRYLLYHRAFQYATDTDGLGVHTIDDVTTTRYKQFCGKNPKFAKHLGRSRHGQS
jgi:hypothetical protein